MNESATLTARGRRTRDAILNAAADLFHRLGVHATSVDDILVASGTGKGQFYHHFGSKEALVRAVLRDRVDRFFSAQAPMLEALNSWEGIRSWFDTILAAHERRGCPGCPFAMLASEMADRDPELRAKLDQFFDRWRACLARGSPRCKETASFGRTPIPRPFHSSHWLRFREACCWPRLARISALSESPSTS